MSYEDYSSKKKIDQYEETGRPLDKRLNDPEGQEASAPIARKVSVAEARSLSKAAAAFENCWVRDEERADEHGHGSTTGRRALERVRKRQRAFETLKAFFDSIEEIR